MASSHGIGLFFLRILIGAFMLCFHGWGKISNFNQYAAGFSDPLGLGAEFSLALAVFAEFFCALLLILGIGTRLVAIPLLITMLVAAFIVHGDDPFQKKEFALLYAIPFFTLIITGGGSFALGQGLGGLRKWS